MYLYRYECRAIRPSKDRFEEFEGYVRATDISTAERKVKRDYKRENFRLIRVLVLEEVATQAFMIL